MSFEEYSFLIKKLISNIEHNVKIEAMNHGLLEIGNLVSLLEGIIKTLSNLEDFVLTIQKINDIAKVVDIATIDDNVAITIAFMGTGNSFHRVRILVGLMNLSVVREIQPIQPFGFTKSVQYQISRAILGQMHRNFDNLMEMCSFLVKSA